MCPYTKLSTGELLAGHLMKKDELYVDRRPQGGLRCSATELSARDCREADATCRDCPRDDELNLEIAEV